MLNNLNWKDSEIVLINNTETSAILEDTSDTLNYYADKYIVTIYEIKTGDIVEYEGINYLIISQIDRNKENYRARIRQADFNIKFFINEEIKEFPAIIESKIFDIETGQYLTLPNKKIRVTLKDDAETTYIIEGKRFIKMGSAWKVVGIDKTRPGLLILNCDFSEFNTNDDKENEVADYVEPEVPVDPPTQDGYSIEIVGDSEIAILETKTYTTNIYNNGVLVNDKSVIWSVSNSRLKIDSTTGTTCTITADAGDYSLGEYTLKATLSDDESVFVEKTIEVVAW
ncbi:hypothetical protein [Brassicibacter mesophilus]|uniref:hypothetical protein n=1 Tax=Brassicibacter mesophilus TaxID=745119 RepID=UPI003D1988AC